MVSNLSKQGIKLFHRLVNYFGSSFLEIKGNIHLDHYNKYFKLQKKHGNYLIDKKMAILPWLREWAEIELEDRKYDEHVFEGEVLYRRLDSKYTRARQKIISSYPELYCLINHKKEIYRLIEDSIKFAVFSNDMEYWKCKSFFKLVEIDKSFVAANWAQDIIKYAEYWSDSRFFHKLSLALQKPGFRENHDVAEYGLAVILLWYLGGRRLKHAEFRDELARLGFDRYEFETGTFKSFLNRLGLIKYPKKKRK